MVSIDTQMYVWLYQKEMNAYNFSQQPTVHEQPVFFPSPWHNKVLRNLNQTKTILHWQRAKDAWECMLTGVTTSNFEQLNGLVQDWPKWYYQTGEFFFLEECLNFLKRKAEKGNLTFPLVPNTMMQRTTNENALVPLCCIHCAHCDIWFLIFSHTKCKLAKTRYSRMFYYLIENHLQKFRHFWRKKKFTWKSHYRSVLHQAIQFLFLCWPL